MTLILSVQSPACKKRKNGQMRLDWGGVRVACRTALAPSLFDQPPGQENVPVRTATLLQKPAYWLGSTDRPP